MENNSEQKKQDIIEQARQAVAEAVDETGDDSATLAEIGYHAMQMGLFPEAVSILSKLKPSNEIPDVDLWLAAAYIGIKNYDEAERVLIERLQEEPESSFAYGTLAKIYMQKNDTDLAIDAMNKSIEFNPNNMNSLKMVYRYHYSNSDADTALSKMEKFAREHKDSWAVWYVIAGHYQQTQNIDKMIDCFKKSLEIDPLNQQVLKALTGVMGQAGKYDEMIELVENSQKQGDVGLPAKFNLAQAYIDADQKDKAKDMLDYLKKEAPESWLQVLENLEKQVLKDNA